MATIARRRPPGKNVRRGPRLFDVVADSEKDRKHWLAVRDSGIGASEAACIFGVNPWESPFTLYQKKRGEIEPQPDNQNMEMGRRLEHVVGELFTDRTGRAVWKHPLGGRLLRSREFPWLLATPDYEQSDPKRSDLGLVECKTTGADNAQYWAEDVPIYYQVQTQQQMLVAARRYNSVACLIGGQRFIFKHLLRNETFLKNLVKKTKLFWDMVQSGTPPDVDASDSTIETLKKMREDGRVIKLPASVLKWHDVLLEATERRKTAEATEKEAKREISAALGTAARGLMPNGQGLYKFETRAGYRVKAHKVAPSRVLKFSDRIDV